MTVTTRRHCSCDEHQRYTAGCDACRKRSREYARTRYRQITYGTWDGARIDVPPVQDHIAWLKGFPHHMSIGQIADEAGVGRATVRQILSGHHGSATKYIADAITSVRPKPDSAAHLHVPAHGTVRRLQGFAAAGHGAGALAELLACDPTSIRRWRRSIVREAQVKAVIARRVRDLADRIGDTLGSSTSARNMAARCRWPRLIEWDDAAIDDPDASPPAWPDSDTVDERAVGEALRGRVHFNRLTTPEKVALYRLWCQQQQNAGLRAGGKPFGRAVGVGEYAGLRISRIARDQDLNLTAAAPCRPSRKAA